MPTYEYQCKICNYELEVTQSITEEPLKTCPNCNEETLQRLIASGGNFILKGRGWYSDLYSKPSDNSGNGDKGNDA